MLFNSWSFGALLLTTFLAYYGWPKICATKEKIGQIAILILASFIFYASNQPILTLLLLASILVNAVFSFMACFGKPSWRLPATVAGISANLAILVAFKYSPMLYSTLFSARPETDATLNFLLSIPLPIGISFFTFQGISLVVDAYNDGRSGGENLHLNRQFSTHLRDVFFFKSFFPQLVAGPIVKAHNFFPQIGGKKFRDIKWERAFSALVVGYFLKMVIADNLKDFTFWLTYPYFTAHSSVTLLFLLFGYSMQIFADFAGYSSIAIGLALLFGYQLPINFNFPYISRSFSEFWTRWHISLSSWLREYLYLPLGGNRHGSARTYTNLMIVMCLGGLWHGATWSYAIWGTWHGAWLVIERALGLNRTEKNQSALLAATRATFVFFVVTAGWLLFKLPNIQHVLSYLTSIRQNFAFSSNKRLITNIVIYSLPVLAYHARYVARTRGFWRHSPVLRGVILACLLFLLIFNSGSPGAFIYFQF